MADTSMLIRIIKTVTDKTITIWHTGESMDPNCLKNKYKRHRCNDGLHINTNIYIVAKITPILRSISNNTSTKRFNEHFHKRIKNTKDIPDRYVFSNEEVEFINRSSSLT